MRIRVSGALLALCLAPWSFALAAPAVTVAATATELRGEIDRKQQREGVLTDDISRIGAKVRGLTGRINELQRRQSAVEADLSNKVDRQRSVADELAASRRRLAKFRRRLAASQKVLADRLVAIYKAGQPDIITVVLNSDGFADLVERATYVRVVAEQDQTIIRKVKILKASTGRETSRFVALEKEASALVAQVRSRRDEIASASDRVVARKNDLSAAVGERKGALATVSRSRKNLESDLAEMEASSRHVAGTLGNAGGGPVPNGSGRLASPISGTFTSPFGTRWGRLHAGIDVAAPEGTPIRAADSGTVRQAGWMGGYGNYTCIQHTATLSTCYAHQSSIGVSSGASVKKGQVIGRSGNTGNSTGPHLHFEVRVSGQPVDPMGYL
ncbi:MAG: murein hydrolase activator EnvC family protein [Solirubrobacterales bacterium]